MRIDDALRIMGLTNSEPKTGSLGFMVSFEVRYGGLLRSDYFPDKHAGESLIETEEKAWELAQKFADNTSDNYVNIYVIQQDFKPVKGYYEKIIRKI